LYHQRQMRSSSLPACGALLISILSLSGCRPLPASKPAALWTAQESRGRAVFEQACARCHNPTTTRPLHGPGLQAITKGKALPSGAPPTDERLKAVILHGRNNMPATELNDDQLSDLLAYLRTL
jgi:mono/diheme cytochrome c family protein